MNTTRELAPEVVRRQRMERAVISALVKAGLKAGYTLGVHDGDEMVLIRSTSYKAVIPLGYLFSDTSANWRS